MLFRQTFDPSGLVSLKYYAKQIITLIQRFFFPAENINYDNIFLVLKIQKQQKDYRGNNIDVINW